MIRAEQHVIVEYVARLHGSDVNVKTWIFADIKLLLNTTLDRCSPVVIIRTNVLTICNCCYPRRQSHVMTDGVTVRLVVEPLEGFMTRYLSCT
jgi:hypothetical protein